MSKRVLSVGQCMADHSRISSFLRSAFSAEVVSAANADEAARQLQKEAFDLVLVNRVFDADGDSGIEFIRRLSDDAQLAKPPILLVSNYEDAQSQAVAAGAKPGFGKASLNTPPTVELLSAYLR